MYIAARQTGLQSLSGHWHSSVLQPKVNIIKTRKCSIHCKVGIRASKILHSHSALTVRQIIHSKAIQFPRRYKQECLKRSFQYQHGNNEPV